MTAPTAMSAKDHTTSATTRRGVIWIAGIAEAGGREDRGGPPAGGALAWVTARPNISRNCAAA